MVESKFSVRPSPTKVDVDGHRQASEQAGGKAEGQADWQVGGQLASKQAARKVIRGCACKNWPNFKLCEIKRKAN